MTITTNDTRDEYTATAGQTLFNYTFKIFESTDLNVYVTPVGQDPDDTTDIVTGYSVTGIGDEDGGTIYQTVEGRRLALDLGEVRRAVLDGAVQAEPLGDDRRVEAAEHRELGRLAERSRLPVVRLPQLTFGVFPVDRADPGHGSILRQALTSSGRRVAW